MDSDHDAIIQKLIYYKEQINEMHHKVTEYLSDRENHLHPFPEDLINEIRSYETEAHKVLNSEVQLRLDSLMYSLLVHERIWKQLFEDDATGDRKEELRALLNKRKDEPKSKI